jgi:hypothetical protein
MAKFRLGNDAFLKTSGDSLTRRYSKGEVVDLDCPPPISAQPLDQPAIDAFSAAHGSRRLARNGVQMVENGKVKVPVAGGGWGEFRP